MFNTRLQTSLVIYAKLERNYEMNLKTKLKIQGSFKLKLQLNQIWKNFILSLKLPCYEKLTKYNFHDVLTALVKNCFAIQHRKSMILREKRLKDARESGVPLSKWETMHEDSPAFHALTITE